MSDIILTEAAASATPSTNKVVLYPKSDGLIYSKDDAGVETLMSSGTSGGDVSKVGTPVDNQIGTWTGDGTIEGDANLTFDNADNVLDLIGHFDLVHTAAAPNDHALEIDVFASGNADVKGIDIVYDTGAISDGDEEAIFVNIVQTDATGGDFSALEVISTPGALDNVFGMLAGALVAPIKQLSGVFGDPDSALVIAVDKLADFINSATNVTMFVADNDTVTIGDAAKFEEIAFVLSTVASGGGITPTFEFSTGVGTWTAFTPADGTNQMKTSGTIVWLDSQIPTWAVGTGSEFLIRITRTANSLSTVPISSHMQISAATEYTWDANGDINARQFKAPTNAVTAPLSLSERSIAPSSPIVNDMYLDDGTNTASGGPGFRRYTGAAWEDVSAGAGNIPTVYYGEFLLTSNIDSTSSTYADIDATNIKQSVTLVGGETIDVGFHFADIKQVVGGIGTYKAVANTTDADTVIEPQWNITSGGALVVMGRFTGLGAGSFDFKPQFKTSANTTRVQNGKPVMWKVTVYA